MWISMYKPMILTALTVAFLIIGCHSLVYSHMETLGISCPSRDNCEGYKNNLSFEDRSCECDSECTAYNDCCIDAVPRQNSRLPARTDVKCIHYGEDIHMGVYVISQCSENWTGSKKVKEQCINNSDDLSDPLVSAPAIDVYQKKTYRNLACAECNNADLASLMHFEVKVYCKGLERLPEEQIMGDLIYNQHYGSWGVYRWNDLGNGTQFTACNVIFDVPGYLSHNVRFCRANLTSTCATDWNRPSVAKHCSRYMAAGYSRTQGYRNPHCALCNHKSVNELSCANDIAERKRPMSFTLLLVVNQSDGEEVGMRGVVTPECPYNHKYDPFFKKCRDLVCALPGNEIVNGKCVKVRQ